MSKQHVCDATKTGQKSGQLSA